MAKRQPLVSAIVPICRREEHLRECLESLLEQMSGIEILCVEGSGCQENLAVVKSYAGRRQEIRFIGGCYNYGAAVNAGLKLAKGEYIGVVAPDAWLDERAYSVLTRKAETTNADVVQCCSMIHYRGDRAWQSGPLAEPFYADIALDSTYARTASGRQKNVDLMNAPEGAFRIAEFPDLVAHHAAPWAMLCRRALIAEHGIHMSESPDTAYVDFPFVMEMLCRAERIAVVKSHLAHWSFRPLAEAKDALGVVTSSQYAARVIYHRQLMASVGEALAAHIVVKNRIHYMTTPPTQRDVYDVKLRDLLRWLQCEQVHLDAENPYLGDYDRGFIERFVEI